MTGTVITILGNSFGAIIIADGQYFDWADPRWIGSPAPRDGRYVFEGDASSFYAGQRVSFTPNPGTILPGGTFETASTATNVAPA